MSDFIEAFRNKFGFGRMTASANADADQMLKSAEWAWHASRECIFIESLKKDAARYRWLRDESIDPGSVIDKKIGHSYVGDYPIYEYRAGQELDDAIDAEMIEVNNK